MRSETELKCVGELVLRTQGENVFLLYLCPQMTRAVQVSSSSLDGGTGVEGYKEQLVHHVKSDELYKPLSEKMPKGSLCTELYCLEHYTSS